ncbi:hypothetical protein FRC07_013762 [Ceratobasidium sp. 392]|nr:hypothetical protein FRC07_013762 [Ceratobasidium sp. 392]
MFVKKRGGSTQTTITETSYPTVPPASTQHHGHKIPEIAGSSGGFLGLVIGLGVLIIACCIGVWILLKKRKDRGEPLWRKRKNVGDTSRSKSMFGGKGKGWVRTGDGEDEVYVDDHARGGIGLSIPRSRSRSPNPSGGVYGNRGHASSASTVKLSAAPGPYPDAFEARDSIDSLVEAPNTPRGKYQGVEGHDHDHDRDHDDDRDVKHSPTSSTFSGGTRFKEAI